MSYVTNVEADTYFASRYPSDEWDVVVDVDKTKTLATATRLINQLNFAGAKTVLTQEDEFPRNVAGTIPVAVQNACCEIAYALLEGHDVEYDTDDLHVVKAKFGQTLTEKQIESTPMHLVHNIPSSQAWNYLRPYLLNTQTLKMTRIS